MDTVDLARLVLARGERVLDVGCGDGRYAVSAYARADVEVVAIDLARRHLDAARERQRRVQPRVSCRKSFALLQADALRLPFTDASFDKVICADVLVHVNDHRVALREMARVLRPGGILGASVPSFVPEWILRRLSRTGEAAGAHAPLFGAGGWRREVERNGLTHVHRQRAHALQSPYGWLQCLYGTHDPAPRFLDWYERLLARHRRHRPLVTQLIEKALNPVLGRSTVMYFVKAV